MKLFNCVKSLNWLMLLAALLVATATSTIAGQLIRPPLPEEYALNFWNFNQPGWPSGYGDPPRAATNVSSEADFDGNALLIDSPGQPAFLNLPVVEWDGYPNIEFREGSVSLWLKPSWNSGNGPENWGRLLDVGAFSTNADGWFSLFVDAGGTNIYFAGQSNEMSATYLSAPINLSSNTWVNLVLTYTPTNSALYLNGQLLTNGSGVTYWPGPDALTNGFFVGSDSSGQAQIHGAIDDLWFYDFPLDAETISNAYSPRSAWDPSMDSEGGDVLASGGGLIAFIGSGGGMALDSMIVDTNAFYLEILSLGTNAFNADTNSVTVLLHNTLSDTAYQLWRKDALTNAAWVVEQNLIGAPDTNLTVTTVSMTNRPTLFFMAIAYGLDTDGDGLPDWWETKYGLDPNNPDTGNTGVPDGYKNPAGDGWSNLEKFQNGWDPSAFQTPPAPRGFTGLVSAGGTNAMLSWLPSAGNVSGYRIIRRGPFGYSGMTTNTASAGATNLTDTGYLSALASIPDYEFAGDFPVQYELQATYTNGGSTVYSAATDWESPAVEPQFTTTTRILRGSGGKVYLAASAIPANVSKLRIYALGTASGGEYPAAINYNQLWQAPGFYNPTVASSWDLPVTNIANGLYQFAVTNFPAFDAAIFRTQPVDADGQKGGNSSGSDQVYSLNGAWIPYLVGTTQIQQNVSFLLRAATADNPLAFSLANTLNGVDYSYLYPSHEDYVFAGFHSYYATDTTTLWLSEFQPFEENYFFRNFIYNPSMLDGTGSFLTGVSGQLPDLSIEDPAYLFPTYSYVVNSNQVPVPGVLSASAAQWVFGGSYGIWEASAIGLTSTGTTNQAVVATGFHNLFGLGLQSVKYPQTSGSSGVFATGYPGDTITSSGAGNYFFEVAQPVLQTSSYYFARPGVDPLPGEDAFSVTNTTPSPLIISIGQPFLLTAWAKQSISNGYSGKFAYAEQYFDKAFKTDTNGSITTNQTGILSEYGEFFPTEPGKVFLTTKPDGATGSTGQCAIYVMKMQLDVNHDGTMDPTFAGPDNTSADRPFGFWINNDHDEPAKGSQPERDVKVSARSSLADFSYGQIRSQRNLEDFTRLWITGLPSIPLFDGYLVTLSWQNTVGNPSINIYASCETNGGTLYLTDTNTAAQQIATTVVSGQSTAYGVSLGTVSNNSTFFFPAGTFYTPVTQHLLFEGAGIGQGELVLTISRSGTNLASTSVFIDLHDIKDLYEQAHVTNVTDTVPNSFAASFVPDVAPPPDPTETTNLIVFVHGWRMGQWDYYSFSESMFKRLYWQGFQGRFASLRWPTKSKDDYSNLPDTLATLMSLLTYNPSEFRAFQSGPAAASYLGWLRGRFPNYTISVASHSMGGIVMMEALALETAAGVQVVDNYVPMQAAVPAQCYQTTFTNFALFTAEETTRPTPDVYRGYPGNIAAAVKNPIVNFYNTNDFALRTGIITNAGLNISVSWEANEISYKPNSPYTTDGTNCFFSLGGGAQRTVTDSREKMSFVARPRSEAVGAVSGVGGVLNSTLELDLTANFGFGRPMNEHSAQFNWNIQRLGGVNGFYSTLLQILSQP